MKKSVNVAECLEVDHFYSSQPVLDEIRRQYAIGSWLFDKRINEAIRIWDIPEESLKKIERKETHFLPVKSRNLPVRATVSSPIRQRGKSVRTYDSKAILDYQTIQNLLVYAFGSSNDGKRPYPSAGAQYPIEPFVCLFTESLRNAPPSGVYHYLAISNELEPIKELSSERMISSLTISNQPLQGTPHFAIVYVSNLRRSIVKYQYRGYRHALVEVGAMYQQASLVATSLGLGSCVWSAFSDYRLGKMLGLNPTVCLPVMVHWFGIQGAQND